MSATTETSGAGDQPDAADRLVKGDSQVTITDATTADPRAAFTAGLRAVADWLDANTDVDLPHPTVRIYSSRYADGAAIDDAASFARAPGRVEKKVNSVSNSFELVRSFGPLALVWSATRAAVCEKRMVTKTVEEWVCPDSLLREADDLAAERAALGADDPAPAAS